MKKFISAILVLVLTLSLASVAFAAGWRSAQYSVTVSNYIDSARLDKGGTQGTWTTVQDNNTSSTYTHYSVPINLDGNTMCNRKPVSSGASVSFNPLWYTSERSLKVRLSKYSSPFTASGSVAAYFE